MQGQKVCDQQWLSHYFQLTAKVRPADGKASSYDRFTQDTLEKIAEFRSSRIQAEKLRHQANALAAGCDRPSVGVDISVIADALLIAASETRPVAQLKKFVERICKDHNSDIQTPPSEIMKKQFVESWNPSVSERTRESSKLASMTNKLLNAKPPQAVAVGIATDVLDGARPFAPGAGHYEVIIGRRFNTRSRRCEFLLRNSYGEDCAGSKKWGLCEVGSNWISADVLMNATSEINWIPN